VHVVAQIPCCAECITDVYHVSFTNVETFLDTIPAGGAVDAFYDMDWDGGPGDHYEIHVRVKFHRPDSEVSCVVNETLTRPL
jgi:hypothetical protein